MSKIRVPKPFAELVKEVNYEKVVMLFGKYHETDRKGRYLYYIQGALILSHPSKDFVIF